MFVYTVILFIEYTVVIFFYMTSVHYKQNGLYNLKQYDHHKSKARILNDLVHIPLLYTINNSAE